MSTYTKYFAVFMPIFRIFFLTLHHIDTLSEVN